MAPPTVLETLRAVGSMVSVDVYADVYQRDRPRNAVYTQGRDLWATFPVHHGVVVVLYNLLVNGFLGRIA